MFTFLHAADIHLDSPLSGLDKYEGAPIDEIRNATRRALENLVVAAIQEKVSFVVLAGDLYDGDWRDCNTGLFFVSQMVRLKDAGIPVYLVAGNHDAASRMSRSLPLPANVNVFSTAAAQTFRLEELDVALHGQSFENQCTTSDLAKDYPAPVAGCFNIGVLHTSLSGREGHGSYAPCSVECLRVKGYDYWALGHVHNRELIGTAPTIAFAGNLQGRHIREPGAKGCLLVNVANDHRAQVRFKALDVFRWESIELDVSEAHEVNDIMNAVATRAREARAAAEGLPLALRLTLTGQSPIHRALQADPRQMTNEIRALIADVGSGSIWLEKVRLAVTAPATKSSPADSLEGPLQEIATLFSEARSSPEKLAELGEELSDLTRKLPPELAHALPLTDHEWWSAVLDEAESRLMLRLGAGHAN
ncbi:MAG: DNA repair exonuclease [Pirellulales bacterium]